VGELLAVRLSAGAAEAELTRCCPDYRQALTLSFEREG
jgi:hypothetical protein